MDIAALKAFVEVSSEKHGPEIVTRQDAMRTNAARMYGFCTLRRISVEMSASEAAPNIETP